MTSTNISVSSSEARKAGALTKTQAGWGPAGLFALEYFRVSSMKVFEQCPHTWASRWLGHAEEGDSQAALIGTAVHTVAEEVIRAAFLGEADDDAVGRAMQVVPVEEHQACIEYMSSLPSPADWNLLALEDEFTIGMWSGMPPIRGHIDAVFERADGSGDVLVVDHKTNRRYDGVDYWSNQLQMLLYAWAVRQKWPGRRVRFRIGYVNVGTNVEWDTSPDDDGPLADRMRGIWERMQVYASSGQWPQAINSDCSWCPVKNICSTYNEAVVDFKTSFLTKVQTTTADKLQFCKDVQKLAKAKEEELEGQLKKEVQEAGGRLEQGGKVWTVEPGQKRRTASFGKVWPTLISLAQYPGFESLWQTVGELSDDLMTVKVGGLDALLKKHPGAVDAVNHCIEMAGGEPTLKGKEIKNGGVK